MSDLSELKLPDDNTIYSLKDETQARSDHRHYDSDMIPLVHKVYESTDYYATAQDYENSSWYFMSVVPDDWYKPWRVKLKFYSYCPSYSSYQSLTYSTITGRADSVIYANWNEVNTTAHYYVTVYPLKKAGYDAGFGHAIGISIYGAGNYTKSAYYRTFEVDYYDCENCTVTILDTPVKWSAWNGTGTTNYGSINVFNACSRGLQETGDNDTSTHNRIGYFSGKTGTQGIWASSLFMETNDGTFENICTASDGTATSGNRTTATTKIPNATGFRVGSPIWYTNTGYNANTNISGGGNVYSSITAIDSRYAFNTELTTGFWTTYKPLYLVGTIHSDGLYYLDATWWTQTPNDTSKVYVLVGGVYTSSTSNCYFTLYEQNKWYRYDGTNLIEISNDARSVNGHTVETDVPSGALFTDTTYTFADGTNCFKVTPSGGSQLTVNVTPSIDNNITGSGTSGNLAKFNGTNTLTSTAYSEVTIPNVTGVGSAPSLSYEEVTVPNVTSVGSVPSLSYEEVTVPNVTSVGTMTTVSVTGTTLNIINGSAPTLGTALKPSKINSWSAGSTPTLGTALKPSKISNWSAGSTPTLGTDIKATKVT